MSYWRARFSITRPTLTMFRDHTKPNQRVHSDEALVAATVEAVSPLDDTDTPLASGAPFRAVAEPAVLLFVAGKWLRGAKHPSRARLRMAASSGN